MSKLNEMILALNTMEEIRAIDAALRLRARQIQQLTAWNFRVSDKVKFNDKSGRQLIGTIMKINTKTIKVKIPDTNAIWNVSPSLLKAA